jgi:FtsZ-interacting cell division protein ZipA
MNTGGMAGAITFTAWQIVLILAVLIVIAAGLYRYLWRERKRRLRKKYAPEYDRLISEGNSQASAGAELLRREQRVQRYRLRSLKRHRREQFAKAWHDTQARFVEDPRMAAAEADELVCRVMRERGYPLGDFAQRAEDLLEEHVAHREAAHR